MQVSVDGDESHAGLALALLSDVLDIARET